MNQMKAAMYTAICAAVVFLGTLLPWWSASYSGPLVSISSSLNGFQYGNGTFTFILCLVGGAAAAAIWKGKTQGLPLNAKQLSMAALGGMGLGALLTLIDLLRSPGGVSAGMGSAGKGIGIYLTLLGAGAGAYCSWVLWQKTPGSASTPTASPPSAASPPPAAPPPAPPSA